MTNFDGVVTADPAWVDVPQLSAVCQALGGAGGPMNAQAVAIVARLGFLANAISALSTGAKLLTGSGAPSDELGANGDLYIDPTALMLYGPKAAGTWPAGVSLQGPAGSAGPSGSGVPNVAVFNYSSATQLFTVPEGVTRIAIEAWGPGEGGRGNGGQLSGASGGYCYKVLTVSPGEVLSIVVGQGGYGGPAGGGSPGGGSLTNVFIAGTTFSVVANGGSGLGGVAYGGDINLQGAPGNWINGTPFQPNGANAPRGGSGGFGNPYNTAGDGCVPGGGGGCAGPGYAGGAGADGQVIIYY